MGVSKPLFASVYRRYPQEARYTTDIAIKGDDVDKCAGIAVSGDRSRSDQGSSHGRAKTSLAAFMFTKHHLVNMPLSHKHLKLDQAKIDKARRLLGLATEQETLDRALDLVIAEEPILRAHRKVKGTGGVVDIFGQ